MARPSKKTLELRKKIIELNLFKRDNEVYINFDNLKNESIFELPYLFCIECFARRVHCEDFTESCHGKMLNARAVRFFNKTETIYESVLDTVHKIITEDEQLQNHYYTSANKLLNIDKHLSKYFLVTYISSRTTSIQAKNYFDNKEHYHFITNEIDSSKVKKILKNALSPERYEYFLQQYGDNINIEDIARTDMFFVDENPLTTQEKQNILKELNANEDEYKIDKTIISLKQTPFPSDVIVNKSKNKNVFAELDLTKPKEEILEYISKLKDDFDNNHLKFKNIYEILGESQDPYYCDLKNCDVLKSKNPKPMTGRFADILFIYDCKKVNKILEADILTNEYIIDEINRYWIDIKNISTDKFHSLDEYYAIAKNYIDNEEYRSYLSGVK